MEFNPLELLLAEDGASGTSIIHWKDGRIAAQKLLPFESVAPIDWWSYQQTDTIVLVEGSGPPNRKVGSPIETTFGILGMQDGAPTWKPLPEEIRTARKLFGTDQVLVVIGKGALPSPYLYDLSTAKARRLP